MIFYSLRATHGDASIPLEVQVASRQVDEKPRCNASAYGPSSFE
jgi:hypothetical protein